MLTYHSFKCLSSNTSEMIVTEIDVVKTCMTLKSTYMHVVNTMLRQVCL